MTIKSAKQINRFVMPKYREKSRIVLMQVLITWIDHPNIVKTLDIVETPNNVYIFMELC